MVVAFMAICNDIANAKPTRSKWFDENEAAAEERRGPIRGGQRGGHKREQTPTTEIDGIVRINRVYRPVVGGHGAGGDDVDESSELPPGAYFGENFGGPHGDGFSDENLVESGQKVLSINLRAAERVDAVIITIVRPVDPVGGNTTVIHGGNGGDLKTPLVLGKGENIISMEAHAGKHKHHTRIKYIKFTTNKGNSIEGGTKTDIIGMDTAKEGYQLSGFVGRSGDELDMVGAIWTSIQSVV